MSFGRRSVCWCNIHIKHTHTQARIHTTPWMHLHRRNALSRDDDNNNKRFSKLDTIHTNTCLWKDCLHFESYHATHSFRSRKMFRYCHHNTIRDQPQHWNIVSEFCCRYFVLEHIKRHIFIIPLVNRPYTYDDDVRLSDKNCLIFG